MDRYLDINSFDIAEISRKLNDCRKNCETVAANKFFDCDLLQTAAFRLKYSRCAAANIAKQKIKSFVYVVNG
ncbi:MAG: hypothetical protein NC350_02820 [Corallococcus sp.]|nr:hypothetical protein [Corallococcus sp.]